MFTALDKLGDVVARFPVAGSIFKENQVDYCCHGNRTIEEAAKEQGISVDDLLTQINTSYTNVQEQGQLEHDWYTEPFEAIIQYVLTKHHAYLQKTMPVLSELTAKILRVHGEHHGEELSQVHRLFNAFRIDMEAHLIKEEETVFPLVIQYEKTGDRDTLAKVVKIIDELESEHTSAGDLLRDIRKVTSDYKIPDDACGTYQYTYEKLEEVEEDTFRHIHLENNILFPRLKEKLAVQTA